jgi:hypothetical protein
MVKVMGVVEKPIEICKPIMSTAIQSPRQCYKACQESVGSIGLKSLHKRFQITLESNGRLVPAKGLFEGLGYMDSLLEKGIPVIAGVHNRFNYKANSDRTTDHFIVIISTTEYWDPADNKYHCKALSEANYQVTQIRRYE